MKPRFLIGVTVVVAVICASTWLLIHTHRAGSQHQQAFRTAHEGDGSSAAPQPAPVDAAVPDNSSTASGETQTPPTLPQIAPEQPAAVAPPPVAPPAKPAARPRAKAGATDAPQPLIPKPIARTALGYVGADGDAEELWANAINDPNRDPEERKDLIEDLNEDGFPDPKHITEDDLPLIVSRLMLIEELAPDAMDDVNAAAFAEAYKDLVNMFDRLARN